MAPTKPRVLCVDDEPMVLEGLELHLQRRFEVVTAATGEAALAALREMGPFAVVVSDMRMPGMSGAQVLAQARVIAPDTVRILLTGHADLDSAISAINEAQIFRFLTKPCPSRFMLATVEQAAEQHRLVLAERELLGQTLTGSVKMLTELLSLACPLAFGRAVRIQQRLEALLDEFEIQERWAIRLASQLLHVGFITLPPQVTEKVYYGQSLSPEEAGMVDRALAVSDQLLANIPRLEPVREIVARVGARCAGDRSPRPGEEIPLGARLLTALLDLDSAEASGMSSPDALGELARRVGRYDASVLTALAAIAGQDHRVLQLREMSIAALKPGMILASDVRLKSGTLLIARRHTVSSSLIERLKNMPPGAICEPVLVQASTVTG